ncbi:MAG: outer membrane protein assembly factor BamE [Proteobacteria bacterium]|nr:outer membrane protein assembly factor BamE [Pseudomonadota bacterium]
MLKFCLAGGLSAAVGLKNPRCCTGGGIKHSIHQGSCLACRPAVNSPPMKQHVLTLLLGLTVITGCSETINTHGQVVLPSRLAQITPGQTTRDEVLQLLGSPSTSGTMNDSRWYYITSIVGSKAFTPHDLKDRHVIIVDFDPSGTVVGLQQKTAADGHTITPDDSITETHGESMGVVEQFIGNLGLGPK